MGAGTPSRAYALQRRSLKVSVLPVKLSTQDRMQPGTRGRRMWHPGRAQRQYLQRTVPSSGGCRSSRCFKVDSPVVQRTFIRPRFLACRKTQVSRACRESFGGISRHQGCLTWACAPSPPGWTLRLLQTSNKRDVRAPNLQRRMSSEIKPSSGLSCSCFCLRRFHGTRGRCRRQGWVRPVHTFLRRDKMGCCRGQQRLLTSEQSDASASGCQNRSDPCWVRRFVTGGWAHFAFKCHPAPHLPERTTGRPAGAAISRPVATQLWL